MKERFVGGSDEERITQVDEGHCFDSVEADFFFKQKNVETKKTSFSS